MLEKTGLAGTHVITECNLMALLEGPLYGTFSS